MKKVFILLVFVFLGSSITILAQEKGEKKDSKSNEQKSEMMVERMSSRLMLNDAQKVKFTPLYKKYCEEMSSLRPAKAEKRGEMTDAQKNEMAKKRFDCQRKRIDIQEKYYNDFVKFMSPSQAQKVIAPMKQCMGSKKVGKEMLKKHDGMKNRQMKRNGR